MTYIDLNAALAELAELNRTAELKAFCDRYLAQQQLEELVVIISGDLTTNA